MLTNMNTFLLRWMYYLFLVLLLWGQRYARAFQPTPRIVPFVLSPMTTTTTPGRSSVLLMSRRSRHRKKIMTIPIDDEIDEEIQQTVDDFIPNNKMNSIIKSSGVSSSSRSSSSGGFVSGTAAALAASSVATIPVAAYAASSAVENDFFQIFAGKGAGAGIVSVGTMDPSSFQPVCSASDGFYRVLQSATVALVGKDNFVEFGPLIAGGLLRIRLELCVVESFFNEAVGPFIAQNGLSWVLPLHETVQTFIAGGIFALAATFILIGSTKLLTVIATVTDYLFGFPARLFGGFIFDRTQGKPVTLDVGLGPWFQTRLVGPGKAGEDPERNFKVMEASFVELLVLAISGTVKFFGEVVGFIRDLLEKTDFFVGRYLVLWSSFYLLIKFLHFKVFPDFP